MNAAHLHLLINHIPIFGVLFGMIAMAWSLLNQSRDMRLAAALLFMLSGIFSWIALETGEGAEEQVEHLPGVSESIIHDHEEAAEAANVAILILAGGSLFLLASSRFRPQWDRPIRMALVVGALVTSGLLARTAYLGGQIRHTEIRSSQGTAQATESAGENENTEEAEDRD